MSRGEIVGRVVSQRMRGEVAHVVNALDTLERNGDLVKRPTPDQVKRLRDGRVVVNVRYVDRTPVRRRRDRTLRRVLVTMGAGFPAAGVGGLVFRLMTGDLLLVALGTLALVAVVVLTLLRLLLGDEVSGFLPGGGHHCPGCPDH